MKFKKIYEDCKRKYKREEGRKKRKAGGWKEESLPEPEPEERWLSILKMINRPQDP